MKNKTLEFFSRTLPILKADETIPKVAKYVPPDSYYQSSTTQKYLQCVYYIIIKQLNKL